MFKKDILKSRKDLEKINFIKHLSSGTKNERPDKCTDEEIFGLEKEPNEISDIISQRLLKKVHEVML